MFLLCSYYCVILPGKNLKKSTWRIRSITKINSNVLFLEFKSLFTWKSGACWPFSIYHVPIEISRTDKFGNAILAAASFFRFWTRFSQKAFKNLWSTQIFFACKIVFECHYIVTKKSSFWGWLKSMSSLVLLLKNSKSTFYL